ncbi:MAG: glycosyltransferase [Pseudomonadota bacterium]
MIFYTLGTQLPFDRMTKAVDDWCEATGRADVFGQISRPGRDGYRPKRYNWVERLAPDAFNETFAAAELIVAHAGMGSILSALSGGKLIVVMPRLARYGEHRNDHQRATAKQFANRAGIMTAADEKELPYVLDRALRVAPQWRGDYVPPFAESRLIDAIRKEIVGASG